MILSIIIHIIKINNKELRLQKIDRHKWPINGCIDLSTLVRKWPMANHYIVHCQAWYKSSSTEFTGLIKSYPVDSSARLKVKSSAMLKIIQ